MICRCSLRNLKWAYKFWSTSSRLLFFLTVWRSEFWSTLCTRLGRIFSHKPRTNQWRWYTKFSHESFIVQFFPCSPKSANWTASMTLPRLPCVVSAVTPLIDLWNQLTCLHAAHHVIDDGYDFTDMRTLYWIENLSARGLYPAQLNYSIVTKLVCCYFAKCDFKTIYFRHTLKERSVHAGLFYSSFSVLNSKSALLKHKLFQPCRTEVVKNP